MRMAKDVVPDVQRVSFQDILYANLMEVTRNVTVSFLDVNILIVPFTGVENDVRFLGL